jgi:LDH2 family malate/lactate/ureidoglycolate dehydrogenase
MRRFVRELFERTEMNGSDAEFMARILVNNDLRCVFSHGTRQAATYVRMIREGKVNPRPRIEVVEESETAAVLDGDGGLGYFTARRGTEMAILKALERGMAAVTTRNHFHIGAAGIYTRMAIDRDCIGVAISSHRLQFGPDSSVLETVGVSPLSVGVPTGEQPPLVLDMGARTLPPEPELMERLPAAFFKALGLGSVFHALGGILAGIWKREFADVDSGLGRQQGAFIAVFAVERFMPVEEFKREMDRYIGAARATRPFPGTDRAELAGGMEWAWERENAESGIMVDAERRETLEGVAEEMGVAAPFEKYEHARF